MKKIVIKSMLKIKDRIYNLLEKNNIEIDEDVYDYGYNVTLKYLCFLIILLPFAIYFHITIELLLFILSYIPMRKNIGGFHFSDSNICLFFSIFICLIVGYLSKATYIPLFWVCIDFIIIVSLTIFCIPIDHPHKRLSPKEKKYYKKAALKFEILYFIIILFLFLLEYSKIIFIIDSSIKISIFSVIISKFSGK